jgi:hypothetical protein
MGGASSYETKHQPGRSGSAGECTREVARRPSTAQPLLQQARQQCGEVPEALPAHQYGKLLVAGPVGSVVGLGHEPVARGRLTQVENPLDLPVGDLVRHLDDVLRACAVELAEQGIADYGAHGDEQGGPVEVERTVVALRYIGQDAEQLEVVDQSRVEQRDQPRIGAPHEIRRHLPPERASVRACATADEREVSAPGQAPVPGETPAGGGVEDHVRTEQLTHPRRFLGRRRFVDLKSVGQDAPAPRYRRRGAADQGR